MAQTITGTYSTGITLTSTLSNPVTVTSGAMVAPTSSTAAIYGVSGGGVYGWTITNAGVLLGQANGVQFGSGGSYVATSVVINQSGGTISAQSSLGSGVYIGNSNAASSVVTNQASATIEGGRVGVSLRGAGTVINYGTITASNSASGYAYGVRFSATGGTVINRVGGYIDGEKVGVQFSGVPGTIINDGTIKGGSHAVSMYGGELIVDQGAEFEGNVAGGYAGCGGGARGTLDLAAATGIATLNATGFSYFNDITFSSGSKWLLVGTTGNSYSNAIYGTVNGFTGGDTIELTGFAASSYSSGYNQLTLASGATQVTLNITGSAGSLGVTTANGNSYVTLLCFARGTKIATPSGETNVEQLAIGDLVRTLDGTDEPIVWIGTNRVQVKPGRRNATTPIIVHKGALAPNVPRADVRLTKGHSLYLDGALIPVECLVNHRSICWDDRARELDIYHIELARHAVLLAEGAPAESYRDDGNRWIFRNANERWDRSPTEPYAPLLMGGPVVDAIWRRLLDRAGPRPGLPLTDEPDLHLIADGQRIDGIAEADGAYRFHLPCCPRTLRVASRSGVPAELGTARDGRLLGVALQRIVVRQNEQTRVIEASDAVLSEGFHDFEHDHGFRWTDGDATLPAALFDGLEGGCELELHVACTARYPLFEEPRPQAAA